MLKDHLESFHFIAKEWPRYEFDALSEPGPEEESR
jgi:hypothetical protein